MGILRAGALNRRVMLLRPGPPIGDGNGTRLGPLEEAGQRSVSVRLARGSETNEALQRDGKVRLSFWLRLDSLTTQMDASWALEHEGRRYQLVAAPVEIGNREGVELIAEAREGVDDRL